MEGTLNNTCGRPAAMCPDPPPPSFLLPIYDYPRSVGRSITGGSVYRGLDLPELHGHYFFADYGSNLLRSFRYDCGAITDEHTWSSEPGFPGINDPTSFGTDSEGELYVLSLDGEVYRLERR